MVSVERVRRRYESPYDGRTLIRPIAGVQSVVPAGRELVLLGAGEREVVRFDAEELGGIVYRFPNKHLLRGLCLNFFVGPSTTDFEWAFMTSSFLRCLEELRAHGWTPDTRHLYSPQVLRHDR